MKPEDGNLDLREIEFICFYLARFIPRQKDIASFPRCLHARCVKINRRIAPFPSYLGQSFRDENILNASAIVPMTRFARKLKV